MVFVHGIPTDYRAWSRQAEAFSDRFRTVSISRRYAYPSKREGDLLDSTVENNAADLKAFIEKMGIAPVHLVGHSYGGFASAFFASNNPELIKSLVLVEPAISTLLVSDPESTGQMLSLLFRMPSVALAARKFQTTSLYPSLKALDAGELERSVELMVDGVQNEQGAFAKLGSEDRQMMLESGRTIGELKTGFPKFTAVDAARISCKTLVVNGRSGTLWLGKIGELLERAIPGCERAVISGAAHFPHIENPKEFNERLGNFIASVK